MRSYANIGLTICLLMGGVRPLMGASANSGASFLKMDAGAGPAALGGAFTSAAGTMDSLGYNPGGLAALERKELLLTHSEWLVGSKYEVLDYGQPIGDSVLAIGISRLSIRSLDGRDELGQPTGDFNAHSGVYGLTYGRSWGRIAGWGVTGKYVSSVIANNKASTFAFDAGGISRLPWSRIWIGAAVLNVGPGLRFIDQRDPLPLTFAIGAAGQPIKRWTISTDLKYEPHNHATTLHVGSEVRPIPRVGLRMGYVQPLSPYADESNFALHRMRAGLGFWFKNYRLDYTIAPFGELGLTHRFTLAVNFGKVQESQTRKNLKRAQPPMPAAYPGYDNTDESLLMLIQGTDLRDNQQANVDASHDINNCIRSENNTLLCGRDIPTQ